MLLTEEGHVTVALQRPRLAAQPLVLVRNQKEIGALLVDLL